MPLLTYPDIVISPDDIVGEALETPSPGDDLIVNGSGVFIMSTRGDVTLSAGDNVFIHGGVVSATRGKTVSITAGAGGQDPDLLGSLSIDGQVQADTVHLTALQDIHLEGDVLGFVLLDLAAGHGVNQAGGTITAGRLQSGGVTGNVTLTSANAITALGNFTVTSGNLVLVDDVPTLTIDGAVSARDVSIVNQRAAGVILLAPTGTVSGHTVALVADDLTLDDGAITATDTIFLAPTTADTDVAVGDNISSLFTISQTELSRLTAPTLTIGRDAAGHVTAGTIHLGDISRTGTLNLFARGDIQRDLGQLTLTGTLNVAAGGKVLLDPVQVDAIGGSAGTDFIVEDDSGDLTVDAITTTAGGIDLFGHDNLDVDGALTAHGGNVVIQTAIDLAINATIDAGTHAIGLYTPLGVIRQSAGSLIGTDLIAKLQFGTGGIVLDGAGNSISGHVAIDSGNRDGDISFTNASAYMIGGGGAINGANGTTVPPNPKAAIVTLSTAAVTLTAGGDITQAGGFENRIFTGTLNLARLGLANPDVTLDNAENVIHALGAVTLGNGVLTLIDRADLTLTGPVAAGSLSLATTTLTLDGSSVTTAGAQSYHAALRLGAAATLVSHAGGITVDGALDNGGFDLTVDVATTGVFGGAISGAGRFIKAGAGTVTFGIDETYDGTTLVNGGTLLVDATIASAVTTVASGATLGGHGTVGAVFVGSGGTLAPGDSPGILTTGDVGLLGGSHLVIELGGATAGLYDQLRVHGGVFLSGALDVVLVNGFAPSLSQSFMIIDNDGADAVNGTFAGLAEGAFVTLGGTAFSISYQGGDGNDVVLTALANHAPLNTLPGPLSVTAGTDLAIAGLAVADPDAGSGTMTTTLFVAHGTLQLASGHAALAGNGTDTVTLTGTLAEIDATLAANVTYRGTAGFTGSDTLTMATSDNGNSGLGGPLTDTDTVKIDVNAVVHVPPVPVIGTDNDDNFIAPAGDAIFVGGRGLDGVSFNFKLTDAAITYAGSDIIIDGPSGSHTIVRGIEVFNFADGTVNTRDSNPLVDDLFYYAHNHDVWAAHVDADAHFAAFGWREGRDPNAWFDTKGYLTTYTDVKAAGINPLSHYDQFGWREGRDPSTGFDTGDYLAHYTDVAAAHVDPLAHFLAFGSEEGRLVFNDGVWG